MAETLNQRIRTIEAIPEFVPVDKDAEMRKAFEEYAKNTIVRAVMDGKTTFSQEYQNAFGNHDSWSTFLPQFLPEGFEQKIADLEACIGESPLDSRYQTKLENPLGMAAISILLGVGLQAAKPIPGTTRRDFLSYIPAVLFHGVVGSLGGATLAYNTKSILAIRNQNAIELDNAYIRIYKK